MLALWTALIPVGFPVWKRCCRSSILGLVLILGGPGSGVCDHLQQFSMHEVEELA